MAKIIFFLFLFLLNLKVLSAKTHIEHFPNGNISLTGTIKNDKKIGTWIFFNENGSIKREITYLDDVSLFKVTNFFNEGPIHSSGLIKNNLQEGEWLYYDNFGKLIFRITFVNGRKNGPFVGYNNNSIPIVLGEFKDDLIINMMSIK